MSCSLILFPSLPHSPSEIDPDFSDQAEAAEAAGFETALVDTDGMALWGRYQGQETLYRGWMLSPQRYQEFEELCSSKDLRLSVKSSQYRLCHYLPEWYPLLAEHTPRTLAYSGTKFDLDEISRVFQGSPLVVKDYVKSLKHYWEEACFIPDSQDTTRIEKIAHRFLELRDDSLEGGLVFREFLDLMALGRHPKSGLKLCLEYRLFFWQGQLLHSQAYWDDVPYPESVRPPLDHFLKIAREIESPFFTMDVACDKSGKWWVIELGDGQVSGLPKELPPATFYEKLKTLSLSL